MFCNVGKDCVISNVTLDCLYEVPLMLHENGLDRVALRILGLENRSQDISSWENLVKTIKNRTGEIKIALVGKYVKLHDSYLSVVEALYHASYVVGKNLSIKWVDSDTVTAQTAPEIFSDVSGIIVPGGFGARGIEGMIETCKYARTHRLPYFGICLGMQVSVIEFARNVLGWENANSSEFDQNTPYHVIDLMPEQRGKKKGGTMRLGAYPCAIAKNTALENAYGEDVVWERHRHRYEFNNDFRAQLENAGLVVSGTSPDGKIVEAVEQNAAEFFVGVQFHPEFKSRPNKPHPLFVKFVQASDTARHD